MRLIHEFRALSEEAQCLFVRMINRKGSIFHRKNFFKYSEIQDPVAALQELEEMHFAEGLKHAHKADLPGFLTKAALRKWLLKNGFHTSPSLSRDEARDRAERNLNHLDPLHLDERDQLIVQMRAAEMEYLFFLYFGHIQKSLTLYTLRDLGIRQSNTLKTNFKPRFSSLSQAKTEYFFAKSREELSRFRSVDEFKDFLLQASTFKNLQGSAQGLKDELLLAMGDRIIETEAELALQAWTESQHAQARERSVRFLYRAGRKEESLVLLGQMQAEPRSDEELLFAEDFLSRKFNKKKVGHLTEILQNSRQIVLSDFYLKKPEQGVLAFYRAQGYNAHFTENGLWRSLFGVLFWDELFENDQAAIHNAFERSPADLVGPDFYLHHTTALERKLALFENAGFLQREILGSLSKNQGRLNDIFQWHPQLAQNLGDFLRDSTAQDVAHILRTMAKKFESHHTGFPDLMVVKEGVISFIEVKAEGDVLRANQLSKLRLLKEAGFAVEVLRVRWETDPQQVYVVVDVETTGGSGGFHRVTEIGAVKIQNGRIIDEFQSLIHPGRSIPSFISSLTGITNEMVAQAPSFADIADKFHAFLEGCLFVAHNVKFDYGFIQREFARVGIEFVVPHLCTCSGMRRIYPGLPSYGLKNLAAHFQISLDQHHRALADARAAAALLLIMNAKRSKNPSVSDTAETLSI